MVANALVQLDMLLCADTECTRPAFARGFCARHYGRERRAGRLPRIRGGRTVVERFWSKVNFDGPPACHHPELGCCYTWKVPGSGWPEFWDGKSDIPAHQWAWEQEHGPVPEGMVLDHFACDGGPIACIRADHVRPASRRENTLRGETLAARLLARTHCDNGHLFDESNTLYRPSGARRCRTCLRERTGYQGNLPNSERTHCPYGHPYDEANTYTPPGSRERQCRACKAIRGRLANARLKAARSGSYWGNKIQCPAGHPYSGDNLLIGKNGARFCRTCRRDRERDRYRRKQATPGLEITDRRSR